MTQNYIERYWRDATPEDAIKEPPMVARFRDSSSEEWKIRKLLRWDRGEDPWISDFGHSYPECQVYDAPDPGEGWRLIDVDSENLLAGDEVWTEGGKWEPIQTTLHYGRRCVIRRRITPAVTYIPFRIVANEAALPEQTAKEMFGEIKSRLDELAGAIESLNQRLKANERIERECR